MDEFKGQRSADECESDNDEDIDLETQVNTSDHGISNDTVGLELALKLRDYGLDTGDDKIVRHADELITQLEYRIVGREEQKKNKQTEITSFFLSNSDSFLISILSLPVPDILILKIDLAFNKL